MPATEPEFARSANLLALEASSERTRHGDLRATWLHAQPHGLFRTQPRTESTRSFASTTGYGEGLVTDDVVFRVPSFLPGTWSPALEDPNQRGRWSDVIRGAMTSVALALEKSTPVASSSACYHVVGNPYPLCEPSQIGAIRALDVAEAIRFGVLSSVAGVVDIQASGAVTLRVTDFESALLDAEPDDKEGEFLRVARDDLQRWLQASRNDLARYVGLSKGTLRNMASGKHRPRPSTLRRFLTLHGLVQGLIRASDETSALAWVRSEGAALLARDFEMFCTTAGHRLFPAPTYIPASRLVWRDTEDQFDHERATERRPPRGEGV